MATVNVLRLTEKEVLPPDTHVYQIDDGTLFYHTHSSPHRLYVKWKGKTIRAKLPDLVLSNVVAYENAVYFDSAGRVYKVTLTPPSISVDFVRPEFADSEVFRGGVCSRVLKSGAMYAYRMWQDFLDGVLVDANEEQLRGFVLIGTHRGKAYYAKHGCGGVPTVTKLSDTVFEIELPNSVRPTVLIRDTWSKIYIENDRTLFVLDTDSMQFMPDLRIEGADISCTLSGIREVLAVMCRGNEAWSLMSAKLPDGYGPE